MAEREKRLRELYESSPAAFSTPHRLHREARKHRILISLPRLTTLMSRWQTYTKFKVKYKNPRLRDRVIVTGPNHLFQIDLAMFPKYKYFTGLLVWQVFRIRFTSIPQYDFLAALTVSRDESSRALSRQKQQQKYPPN